MLWIRIYIFESGSSCFLNGNADPDQGAFSMRIRIRREIECRSTRIRIHSPGRHHAKVKEMNELRMSARNVRHD